MEDIFEHKNSSDYDDDDLIKEDLAFQKNKEITPAAKLIRIGKRKNEFEKETNTITKEDKSNDTKKGSKFSKSRFSDTGCKKIKESLSDYTVLQEAISKQRAKSAVLGGIVERDVPTVSPLLATWKPFTSSQGFPQVKKLNILDIETTSYVNKKSLYLQQFEKEELGREKEDEITDGKKILDENISQLGCHSYILRGGSGLGKSEEAENIHKENMTLLSKLSHEERIKERNEILSLLSKEQIAFILSLRANKDKNITSSANKDKNITSSANKDKNITSSANKDKNITSSANKDKNISSIYIKENYKKNEINQSNESTFQSSDSLNDTEIKTTSKDVNLKMVCDETSVIEPIIPEDVFASAKSNNLVNMNKIEAEKLRWTGEIPTPKPLKNNEGFIARFNFEGDLLPYDADISWREGLHHHGEEPGRAGYTMDELFIFVRSKVTQQRHLGLKTLANILRNAKEGLYDECFETSIIQLMVDAGLVLLLRFAIDETTALVYQEALRALYYLICSEPDEKCLDLVEGWVPHDIQPAISSKTHSKKKDRNEFECEENELKDVEVIHLDIIRALLRMDVHIRLRYLLESVVLSPPDIIHILGILKRISRHSLSSAWAVVSTPRLLSIITDKFLPCNITALMSGSNFKTMTSVYGVPLTSAVSLFKVLAKQGRTISSTLINNYDMMSRILAYVSMEPTEVCIPQEEALSLAVEAYSLWAVFLSYGLTKSQHSFSSFYPMIIKQLIFYRDKIDINDKIDENKFNYNLGSQLGHVINKALCIAATTTLLTNRMKNNEPSITTFGGKEEVLQPPVLHWKEFDEILTLVESCLWKWVAQFTRNNVTSFSGRRTLGVFFIILNTYYSKWKDQNCYDSIKAVKKIEEINKVTENFLLSNKIDSLLNQLSTHSSLKCTLTCGVERDPQNLGSIACVCLKGEIIPVLRKDSPYPFMLPFLSLLSTLITIHPELPHSHITNLLDKEEVKIYLTKICSSNYALRGQWMNRIEIFTLVKMMEIASVIPCSNISLYHRVAIALMPLIHNGDEIIVKILLTSVICNPKFIKDASNLESQIHEMSLKEFKALKSPAFEQPTVSPLELTRKIVQNISSIGQDYVKNILSSKSLENSAVRHKFVPFLTNSQTQADCEFPLILDEYWPLTPLKMMYLMADKEDARKKTSLENTISVTRWIQLTYLLLRFRKSFLSLNYTGWLRHISLIFTASSDLFLNPQINSYVQACLSSILENENFKTFNWSHNFINLPFTFDWYKELVEHFGSVSYGDSTFALFVIIPIQRYWPESYRMLLYGENVEAIQFIRLTCEEVSSFIPMSQFLDPFEDNEEVIAKYKEALANDNVNEKRNPFLFYLAKHHVMNYEKSSLIEGPLPRGSP